MTSVVGTCMEMCPLSERTLREREGLLHKFEYAEGSIQTHDRDNYQFSTNSRGRGSHQRLYSRKPLPRGDINRIVKSFARSAAGLDKMIPEDLRPAPILLRTANYLCREILTRDEPFHIIYDFVFDRLRSVRQDLVIQRISNEFAIQILEIIVRFHVFAAYRLQDSPMDKFDPHINHKHLIDCLKRLMCFYEMNNYNKTSRNEFEALYVIATPETNDSICRAIQIRRKLNSVLLDKAIQLSFSRQNLNYVKYFALMSHFPILTASFFTQQVRSARSSAFTVITSAYGVSSSKIPLSSISTLLRYPSMADLIEDLTIIGAKIFYETVGNEQIAYVKFAKANSSSCNTKAPQLSRLIAGIGLEDLHRDELSGRAKIASLIAPGIVMEDLCY